jgi:hypothetical protein
VTATIAAGPALDGEQPGNGMLPAEPEPGLQVSPGLAEQTKPGIISLRSAKSPEPEKRVPAFSVDGTVYSILVNPRMNQGMRYVHIGRKQGSEMAADYMLEVLLGEDGYEALLSYDALDEADLEAIMNAASRIMAGAVDAPKGKPSNGSSRSRG